MNVVKLSCVETASPDYFIYQVVKAVNDISEEVIC